MNLSPRSEDARPNVSQLRASAATSQLSLGELVELVASAVPEEDVADTVAAFFDTGIASFARLLSRDERQALRRAS